MGIRDALRRLEQAVSEKFISIPQRDATVKRFTEQDLQDASLNMVERAGAGEDAPPEHPILEAVRNSDDPQWRNSFFAVGDPEAHTVPIEDLSEP